MLKLPPSLNPHIVIRHIPLIIPLPLPLNPNAQPRQLRIPLRMRSLFTLPPIWTKPRKIKLTNILPNMFLRARGA